MDTFVCSFFFAVNIKLQKKKFFFRARFALRASRVILLLPASVFVD